MAEVLKPGSIIDNRYELISHIGSGGFGVVYKAKQLTTGQLVAVKIARVLDEKQSSGVAARFKREMAVVADLSHPNIVRLIDAGQLPDKRLFAVLELIRGTTLSELLGSEGPMSPTEAKHLMTQVLDALCSAHDLGVIHRDLKPANIMVTNVGARRNALVLDFGIATFTKGVRAESYQSLTPVGAVGGTPAYMAPEQLHGKMPNPQTDIYSWGLVFLECLTGQRVVRGSTIAETMFTHLRPDPHPLPPSVAMHHLGRVIRSSLSKDSASRYPDARVVLKQLIPCDVSALRRLPRPDRGEGLDKDTAVLSTEEPFAGAMQPASPAHTPSSGTGTSSSDSSSRSSSGTRKRSSITSSKSLTVVAERRQLTAMVCELGPLDLLSENLDPSDLYELMNDFRRVANSIVRQLDGISNRWEGTRLISYFGYPVAHEDDACRAVQAALEIAACPVDFEIDLPSEIPPLQVQTGIHSGLVVTSNLHLGNSGEISIVGDVARIAVRLQENSEPDAVLISEPTQRLIRERFTCEPAGEHGRGRNAFALYRVHSAIDGATMPASRTVTAIGRDSELAALTDRWEETLEQRGQVVLVSGEAGIGKSHLVAAFRRRTREYEHLWLEMASSPYLRSSSFHPLLHAFGALFGFQPKESPRTRRDKMRAFLDDHKLERKRFEDFLIVLLDLEDPSEDTGVPGGSVFRQPVEEQLLDLMFALAETTPLVLHLEDLHWADPSTIEFVHLLVDQAPLASLFVLATTRPSYLPDWRARSHVTAMPLSRLPRKRVEAMIRAVAGDKVLPDELVTHLAIKTDGVPLFVEELTKTVLESDALVERDGHYHLASKLDSLAIPVTLRGSLMARLDRLGPIKEIAQIAAIIGREFTFGMLENISDIAPAELGRSLAQLVQAELIIQRGRPPRARYTFKHALVQDTAYESLLDKTRRHYHEQIGDTLETLFPDIVQSKPELVAHHYTEARQVAKAVPYWLRAGNRATERSAHAESIQHLRTGIDLLHKLPESRERDKQELGLVMSLGMPYMATRGYGSTDIAENFSRALHLCRELGEDHVPTLWGLWIFYHVRAEYANALELGEQLHRLAERENDTELALCAHQSYGSSLLLTGAYDRGITHLKRGIDMFEPSEHSHMAFIYGQDPGMYCHVHLSWALFARGQFKGAVAVADKSIERAERIEHPNSIAFAKCLSIPVFQQCGDMQRIREQSAQAMALCAEYHLIHWLAFATFMSGLAHADLGDAEGDFEKGVADMRGGLNTWRMTGARIILPYFHSLLAEKLALSGRLDEAIEVQWQVKPGNYDGLETFFESTWKRVSSWLLLKRDANGDREQAETLLQEAIQGARTRGDHTAEIACLAEQARLHRRLDRSLDAQLHRMRELMGAIEHDRDIAILKTAKRMLAEHR